LELRLHLTCGLSRANDLNCERHRYGKRFVGRTDQKLTAFVELEREVLTVTFYLESIHADSCLDQ
jgi:hypothetical protein